jgi:hypothetical protein
MKTSMPFYRLIGAVLVTCGILGYFTVADELRHTGEFIGVSSVLLAGIILLMVDSRKKITVKLAIQWIAFGLLAGIPIGGIVLDNMFLGIVLGIAAGVILAFMLGKINASGK